ncbi:hypothetical protein Droror1_Dr00007653 [Drosera rotundifolia]
MKTNTSAITTILPTSVAFRISKTDGPFLDSISHFALSFESRFSDACNFLISTSKEKHIWCSYGDAIGPLLETFCNYYKEEGGGSPLKVLWKRMCYEMRGCTQCVSRHHRAQETCKEEYEPSVVDSLLGVLRTLDEERVAVHLKEVNGRMAQGGYDAEANSGEIVSLMFEVLTFPILLDDQFLANEFQVFIEAVDNAHELSFASKQFPGVYALLFLKRRRARSIGLRLAGTMGKIRSADDLEGLQPLLWKYINFLALEMMPSSSEVSRPRLQLDRPTIWIGIKALLGFLDPPALEEGILEPYPVFLNLVLDHISDDSPEFSHAVICMRELLEILGCKLWLRTSLPPSVMRDSLLSQCFHTKSEKIHKEIFDLFYPFLRSLEALQDGEFEKQRRHLLYFLLHQVTRSSNFSSLMRKKACQISILIIDKGYRMNPPCPPSECAHMWGPSVISSLKDVSLHTSLRQPAIDLIQTIIVSDAAALVSSLFHRQISPGTGRHLFLEATEDSDDGFSLPTGNEEKDGCCWNEFSFQGQIAGGEYSEWLCTPMLWYDILVEMEPSVLPISVSKAVLWALSHLCLVEPEKNSETTLPAKVWISSNAPELSSYLGWKSPTGSNDGGDGKEMKNSVRVSTMCLPLIRAFKKLAAHFMAQIEGKELWRQWTWEPRMGECLILLLGDPNDNTRQVGRRILEHLSNTRGLACSLQFLCGCRSSLSSIYLGIRHALKLAQLDSVLLNFQNLHNLFFLLYKILKEGFSTATCLPGNSSDMTSRKFLSQGGFLRQPTVDPLPVADDKCLSKVDNKSWEDFICAVARVAWPSLKKCLQEGKIFIDYRISQMTCVRILEILPIVFEKIIKSAVVQSRVSELVIDDFDFRWLHHLVDWAKSSLEVVSRYWKQCVILLLDLLKISCSVKSAAIIQDIERIVSSGDIEVDSLMEQVSRLSLSLSSSGTSLHAKTKPHSRVTQSKIFMIRKKDPPLVDRSYSEEDADMQMRDLEAKRSSRSVDSPVVLSDDKNENKISAADLILSGADSRLSHENNIPPGAHDGASLFVPRKMISPTHGTSSSFAEPVRKAYVSDGVDLTSRPGDSDAKRGTVGSFPRKLETIGEKRVLESKSSNKECLRSLDKVAQKKSSGETNKTSYSDTVCMDSEPNGSILKELVRDAENVPLEFAFSSAQKTLTKAVPSVPKRRVIQLNVPFENRSGYSQKFEVGVRRFKPPRLEEWFRAILELDYFATVGLASPGEDENRTSAKLQQVPVCFESPEQYVDIFRPLVLEEFKAQLCSAFQEISSIEDMSCGSLSVVSVERVDDFHLVRCIPDERDSSLANNCMENDLLLLTKQPLQNSGHHVHMIGKLEKREKDNKKRLNILVIRLYFRSGCARHNRARKLLLERSKWFVGRITSIIPQLREFHALSSIKSIPALPVILNPTCHRTYGKHRNADLGKLSPAMQQALESRYNASQLQAISASIQPSTSPSEFQLSLIQGPPGTGKTRTIVAIISALLAQPYQPLNSGAMPNVSTMSNSRTKVSESVAIARAWQDAALAKQLVKDEQMDLKSMKSSMRGRILVCAHSNAAVDELLSRLTGEGLYAADGNMYKPYIVRVGNAKTIHPNSFPFFIDTLVENRLTEERIRSGDPKDDLNGDSSSMLRSNLEKIADHIRFYESKRANLMDGGSDMKNDDGDDKSKLGDSRELSEEDLKAKLKSLYGQKKEIYMKLAATQAQERISNDELRTLRKKLRQSILKEAKIVVATLSGSGGDLYTVCSESALSCKVGSMSQNCLFDAVIIDEAAQALEPASLIPLQLLKSSGTKCIMVGDPKQLPATVLSNVATKYLFECSMFERLQRAGSPVIMLTEQYRMNPEICRFPSLHFYDGKLLNGALLSCKIAPFHATKGLGPYVFYDVIDGQECYGKNPGSSSLYNEEEANAAVEIVKAFKSRYPSEYREGRIGIITPYKAQNSFLRSRFSSEFGSSLTSQIEFNTVDGYQGREVDILILTTVRASDSCSRGSKISAGSIGFVADVRRMNVALTRARLSLWILGNTKTLKTNYDWDSLIKDAVERNVVITLRRPYKSMLKSILDGCFTSSSHGHNAEKPNRKPESSQNDHHTPSGIQTTDGKITQACGSTSKNMNDRKESLSSIVSDGAPSSKKRIEITFGSKSKAKRIRSESSGNQEGAKNSQQRKVNQRSVLVPREQDMAHSQHNPSQKNGGKSMHSVPKGSQTQSKDMDVNGQPTNKTANPIDLIAKRKLQRDAVDELLSSALFSSNSGTSKKAAPNKAAFTEPSASGGKEPRKQMKGGSKY